MRPHATDCRIFPKSVYVTALKMLLLYHMKPTDAVVLYNPAISETGEALPRHTGLRRCRTAGVTAELIKKPMTKVVLFARADHTGLQEKSTYDVAAIRIEARDEYGNLLSFFNEPVSFEVSGPVELIGPSVISLEGGMGGTYIKTTGESGEARLVIRNAQTEPVELRFAAAAERQRL